MARSLSEIQNAIFANMLTKPALVSAFNLDSSKDLDNQTKSGVAIWYLWLCIHAFGSWTLEQIFDQHTSAVNDALAQESAHRVNWYYNKVKDFCYDFILLPDSDQYDLTGKTDNQITKAKIIAHCAIIETDNQLLIKVAKLKDGTGPTVPLDDGRTDGQRPEFDALCQYMEKVKDVGVKLQIISRQPDQLQIEATIYYDPAILDGNGARLDSTNATPVQDAVNDFLNTLNNVFNGDFVPTYLVDAMQQVEGVVIPILTMVQWKDISTDPFTWRDVLNLTESGNRVGKISAFSGYYTTLQDDGKPHLTLNFLPYV